jgi:AraC-like DNA-binding protein
MKLQSDYLATIEAQTHDERLRFWRPLPREVADIICGEGAVDALPYHAHDAWQVMLPASQYSVLDGRRGAVLVRPGQLYITAPFELHGTRGVGGVPCGMRVVLVGAAMLPTLRDDLLRLSGGSASEPQQFVLDDPALYGELWGLIDDMHGPLVALTCAPRLLACLTRLLAGFSARPSHASRRRVGRQAAGVGRVRDHLRAHVAESLSLDELAAVAGLSKFYLLRAFRFAYGVTPHAYQMQLRLAYAWRLIVDGRPLSHATYDAGFADQSHLTRRFASAFGLSPARYARELAMPPGSVSSDAFGTRRPAVPASSRSA